MHPKNHDDLLRLTTCGGRRNGQGKRAPRQNRWELDDDGDAQEGRTTCSLRHDHSVFMGYDRKQSTIKYKVIYRMIAARVGEPWNTIRSDLMHRLTASGRLASRIREHLDTCVEQNLRVLTDGRIQSQGCLGWLELRRGDLYLDDAGLVQMYTRDRKPRGSYRQKQQGDTWVTVQGRLYVQRHGLWYAGVVENRMRTTGRVMRNNALVTVPGWADAYCQFRGSIPFLADDHVPMALRQQRSTDPVSILQVVTSVRQISGEMRDRLGLGSWKAAA